MKRYNRLAVCGILLFVVGSWGCQKTDSGKAAKTGAGAAPASKSDAAAQKGDMAEPKSKTTNDDPAAKTTNADSPQNEASADIPKPVPQDSDKPSGDQAEAIAALKDAGAEIELGPNGEAVSVAFFFGPVTDAQFSKIETLPTVKAIELVKVTELTAQGLAPLAKLSGVEELALMSDDLTDSWLVAIAGLQKLKRLELTGNRQITDEGLKHLSGLTGLVELRLGETQISDAGLAHLKGLTGLEVLELKRTDVTDAGLAHLKAMPKLRELQLSGKGVINDEIQSGIGDAGLAHLKDLGQLEMLDLSATKISDAGLEQLAGLKNLKTLLIVFSDNVTAEGVTKFKELRPDCQVRGPEN